MEIIDPLEYDFGLLQETYYDYPKDQDPPEKMKVLSQKIKEADGFVVVGGEYNHNMPPALVNLMDHFYAEYRYKPSGIVAYSSGSYAGARSSVQLRSFLGVLGTPAIQRVFHVPNVQETLAEDGTPLDEKYEKRFGRFAEELEWYMDALKTAREKGSS